MNCSDHTEPRTKYSPARYPLLWKDISNAINIDCSTGFCRQPEICRRLQSHLSSAMEFSKRTTYNHLVTAVVRIIDFLIKTCIYYRRAIIAVTRCYLTSIYVRFNLSLLCFFVRYHLIYLLGV